jgi:hypothetical protein
MIRVANVPKDEFEAAVSNFAQRHIQQRRIVSGPLTSGGHHETLNQVRFSAISCGGESHYLSFCVRASRIRRPWNNPVVCRSRAAAARPPNLQAKVRLHGYAT